MNSRASSFTLNPHATGRPSINSRLSFAVSSVEQGEGEGEGAQEVAPGQVQIAEEIAEIKRYEV